VDHARNHSDAAGNCESGAAWYASVPHLARHVRIVRPDMRGYGASTPMPRDFPWTLDILITTQESGLATVERTRAWQERIPDSELRVLPGNSYHVAMADAERCARDTRITKQVWIPAFAGVTMVFEATFAGVTFVFNSQVTLTGWPVFADFTAASKTATPWMI
jgi:hypothetical protein